MKNVGAFWRRESSQSCAWSRLADRRRLFVEWHLATGLYLLGTASLVGLGSIATRRSSRRLQAALWVLAGVTGMGVAGFERPKIASDMTGAYAMMAIWLPLAVTGMSIAGLMLTLGLRSCEKDGTSAPGGQT